MAHLRILFSPRSVSLLRQTKTPSRPTTSGPHPQSRPNKKPLHILFTEALGLSEKPATIHHHHEEAQSESDAELKNSLRQLEQDITNLKGKTNYAPKKAQKTKLFSLFTNQPPPPTATAGSVTAQNEGNRRVPEAFKKLSTDTITFLQFLHEKGYLNDANFVKGKKGSFDVAWFDTFFARGYVKFAAQRFAADNRDIAKWLSGSALKQVVAFGCPSTNRSYVIPAKMLRKFFEIPENTVCNKCSLRESCKFVNQNIWNCNTNNLDLTVVMKVITTYALEFVNPELVVPDEVKNSVSQLLKEVVKLSQTP